jgi:hypothetical protein
MLTPTPLNSESVHASPADKWKEYTYKNDGFAISAPSKPVMGESRAAGGQEVHTYYILIVEGSGILVVYSPLIPENLKSPEKVLSDGRDGAARNGKVVSETQITLGGYPGLDYEVLTAKQRYHWRCFVADKKLYQILSYAPPEHMFLPETDRVIESFKLIPGGK